jgi:hypothetical protein
MNPSRRPSVSFIVSLVAFFVAGVASMVGCAGSVEPDPLEAADLVFYGEHILTVDPQTANAEAVAVRGASIVAAGSKRHIAELIGDETRVVELGEIAILETFARGRTVYTAPGIESSSSSEH